MKYFIRIHTAILFITYFLMCNIASANDSINVKKQLDDTIDEGIHLIETMKYKELILHFRAPASDNEPITDELITTVARQSKRMIVDLKSIKNVTPEFSQDGNEATYNFPENSVGHTSVKFQKINNVWYWLN